MYNFHVILIIRLSLVTRTRTASNDRKFERNRNRKNTRERDNVIIRDVILYLNRYNRFNKYERMRKTFNAKVINARGVENSQFYFLRYFTYQEFQALTNLIFRCFMRTQKE